MTLAKKIQKLLKDELSLENIQTVVDMAEFLKFKENQETWNKIDQSEKEYVSKEEHSRIEEIKLNGEFFDENDVLSELGINRNGL